MRKFFYLLLSFISLTNTLFAQDWERELVPTPEHENTFDFFGKDVASYQDIVAVGVPGNSENHDRKGYVQLLKRNGSGYDKIAKLRPSKGIFLPTRYVNFGFKVQIYDGLVAVIGNTNDYGDGRVIQPAIFLFEEPDSGWEDTTESAILDFEDFTTDLEFPFGGEFGDLVISEQYIALGFPFYGPENRFNSGAVYIFEKPTSGWSNGTYTQRLAPDLPSASYFGHSIDLEGTTLVVGNARFFSGIIEMLPISVYEKEDQEWKLATLIESNLNRTVFNFGRAVGIKDNHIFFSYDYSVNNNLHPIEVQVIEKPELGWASTLNRSTYNFLPNFSQNIFDVTLDISNDAVALGINSERFELFEKEGQDWSTLKRSKSTSFYTSAKAPRLPPNSDLSEYGLIFGTPADHRGGFGNGSILIREKTSERWDSGLDHDFTIFPDRYFTSVNGYMGYDLDSDEDIVVTSKYNTFGQGSNRVLVYKRTILGLELIAELTPPEEELTTQFGKKVSVHNDVILVSASTQFNFSNIFAANVSGKVYVYEKPVDGWRDMAPTAILTPSNPSERDAFGESISQTDNCIVIAATGQGDYGEVYVYSKESGESWVSSTESQRITTVEHSGTYQRFGSSVLVSENELFIAGFNKIFVYDKNDNDEFEGPTVSLAKSYRSNSVGQGLVYDNNILVASVRDHYFDRTSSGQIGASAAYVYEKPSSGWVDQMPPTTILIPTDSSFADPVNLDIDFDGKTVVLSVGKWESESYFHFFNMPEGGWGASGLSHFEQDTTFIEAYGLTSISFETGTIYAGIAGSDESSQASGALAIYKGPGVIASIRPDQEIPPITFYPNPASDFLIIDTQNQVLPRKVCFYNMQGQLQKCVEPSSERIELDGLRKGLYLVRTKSPGGKTSSMIVQVIQD